MSGRFACSQSITKELGVLRSRLLSSDANPHIRSTHLGCSVGLEGWGADVNLKHMMLAASTSALGVWCAELVYPASIRKTGRWMTDSQVGKISNPSLVLMVSLAPPLPGSLIAYKINNSGKESIWDWEQGTEASSAWWSPMVMNKGYVKV